MNKIFPVILIGAAAYIFFKIKDFAKKIDYQISSLTFLKNKSSIETLIFNLGVVIENPTNVNASFESIDVDLIYKGTVISTILLDTPGEVKANKKTVLNIPMKVPVIKAAGSLINSIKEIKKGRHPEILVRGDITLSTGNYHFETTKKLTV